MSATTVLELIRISSAPTLCGPPGTEPHSTADLMVSAVRVAEAIRDLPGFRPGRHVALALPASVEWASALVGAWLAGAVPASLNPGGLADELDHCMAGLDLAGLLRIPSAPIAEQAAKNCPRIDVSQVSARHGSSGDRVDTRAVDPERDALILFTSGSTGRPRGVRLTHRGLVCSVGGLTRGLAPKDEVFLIQAPMHHVFGVVTLLIALSTGSGAVLLPAFQADTALAAISEQRATIGFGPIEMFLAMATCPGIERYDLSSFRRILVGGSPAREAQLLAVERWLGLDAIYLSFGMTETTGGVTLAPLRGPDGRPRIHAGRPVETIEIGIFDGPRRLGIGEEGELRFRGPHVTAGYLGEPPRAADEWLTSGDLGLIDLEGLLHVTGRIKEIIIKAGENISIAEVERVVAACTAVREVCVVGIPDERLGENVAAAVVASDPTLDRRGLQRFCQGRLLKTRIPQKVLFVESLPRLATGKVDRRAVRALFGRG